MSKILKYIFGNPIETESTVVNISVETLPLPFFETLQNEEAFSLLFKMDKDDIVYGLGENIRGINKRGYLYISNCSDDPSHSEEKHSLYGAHNFLIVSGIKTFGVFVDYPAQVKFDIGFTKLHELVITPETNDFIFYIIEGNSEKEIVQAFRRLIGRSYIPPQWAFGYGQSRWSYMNETEIKEVVKMHRENGIPLDSVYMDIDYMERYKDFTIDEQAFPNFPEFVEEMKRENVHLVPIIDAGVKIEAGYDAYEEGIQNGYFCKKEDGTPFVAGVWPGKVHFPDMLNKEARDWFGEKYKFLLDQGIEGFWNDMNEPAMFYTEDNLKEVYKEIAKLSQEENLDIHKFFYLKDLIYGLANNKKDYESFYHEYNGEKIRHDRVHNLYGYYMTRAAGEAFEKIAPDKRILLFSRASYIGMHRYGGIWTGDNMSWWSHILLNIKMMPSLNMCGFLYTGADIGGFGANATEDLLLRWLAFGIFTPLMRNHSALGTRVQEAYRFENKEAFAKIIGIRYGLLPYLYSEFMKAALGDEMMFLPLGFEYRDDETARGIEDQLLLGESLMLAPVYEQNAAGRYVYLPESMKLVRMKSLKERSFEILPKGHHYILTALDEVVFFIRPEKMLPLSKGGMCVEEVDFTDLEIIDFVTMTGSYELYLDDGYSKDYDNQNHIKVLTIDKQKEK